MEKIKVLVVDDSPGTRASLRACLEKEPAFAIAGEAPNGREAIALAARLKPDLVTIGLDMPGMDGLETIAEIMAASPVPILVVAKETDATRAYAAVSHGALDMVSTPGSDAAACAAFIAKVKLLAKVPVIRHIRTQGRRDGGRTVPPCPAPIHGPVKVCAIVASTGGPQALATILGMLPSTFPCPILISQHIADGFAAGMVEWLGTMCKMPVRLACDGERPQPSTVYLSPSEASLVLGAGGRLQLIARQRGQLYSPTCDLLLASVAKVCGSAGIGVILTGMGSDGAAGLSQLRQAGGATVAQDEATSVIFGMNRVAIDSGAASLVLPLEDIGQALCRLAGLAD